MTYDQFKNYGQHLMDVKFDFRVISLQMAADDLKTWRVCTKIHLE